MRRRRPANGASGRLRVALAQVEPVLGDLAANLPMHLSWTRKAIASGADMVIFPELSLTGYMLQDLVCEVAIALTDVSSSPTRL